MPSDSRTDKKKQQAILRSVTQVFESLIEIVLDAGIPVSVLNQSLRYSAVQSVRKRFLDESGRANKVSVALATGLSRSEVARCWDPNIPPPGAGKLDHHPMQRVISAWFNSPEFLSRTGDPDSIPVFGHRRSLERLVKDHGGGIPVRAMLDELLRIGTVELLPQQRLKVKSRVPIQKGFHVSSLRSIGLKTSDLLNTLTRNLSVDEPLFEGSVSVTGVEAKSLPLVQREIASRGSSFLGSIEDLLLGLKSSSKNRGASLNNLRAGVGVFYFERQSARSASKPTLRSGRKNLRRAPTTKHKDAY